MTTSAAHSPRPTGRGAPGASGQGWLYGPIPDLLLGCGVGSIAVTAALAWWGAGVRALIPGALLVLVFSLPHYGATLLRVYELPAERRKYALFAVWATLFIGVSFVVGLQSALLGSLILTLYLTWSPWHYTGQNYGIFLMLLGRRGVAISVLTKRLIYASFILSYVLAFLAIHGVERSANYAPVTYAGTVFYLMPLGIPRAVAGPLLIAVAGAYAFTLAFGVTLLWRVSSLRQIAPSLVLAFTQSLWFSVPVLLRFSGVTEGSPAVLEIYSAYGFLWIASAHAIQYLWITTYYATNAQDRAARVRFLSKAALAGFAIWTVPVLVFAPGLLGSLPHEAGLALLVAAVVNLHHFVLDGVVWKLRDGRVSRVLLRGSASEGGSATPGASSKRHWVRKTVWAVGGACVVVGLLTLWLEADFRRSLASGDLDGAANTLQRMTWLGRDGPDRRTRLGRHLASRGEYRRAQIQFQRSVALHPTPEAWRSLGLLNEQSGDLRRALGAYQAALRLDDRDGRAWYSSGLTRAKLGDFELAVEELEHAAELAPGEKLIHASLERARRSLAKSREQPPARSPPR